MIDYTFWAVAIAAVFIVGLSKSGLVGSMGMVAVPMLALVMPAREATGMMLSSLWDWGGLFSHEVAIAHCCGPWPTG